MSKLAQSSGDDHPEAAGKLLTDAISLKSSGRFDTTVYLSGYVAECCLKSLILLEGQGTVAIHGIPKLSQLVSALAAVAGTKIAKYVSSPAIKNLSHSTVYSWQVSFRYRAPGSFSQTDATNWLKEVQDVYNETVVQMKLDGVL
jgi:HEPN domain-containing protein